MKFNNEYCVELIDSSTGVVKQSGVFHNLVLNTIHTYLASSSNTDASFSAEQADRAGYSQIMLRLAVGSSGTEPDVTQTGPGSVLWTANNTNPSVQWLDDHTVKATATYSFPATSAYVGTVREVCIGGYYKGSTIYHEGYGPYCTRALLTDSEGQPISFAKTDTDILKVTVSIEISMSSGSGNFRLFRRPAALEHLFTADPSYGLDGTYGNLNLLRFAYDLMSPIAVANTDQSVASYGASSVYSASKLGESYIRYATKRLGTGTVTSETYYRAIAIPNLGYWQLPNEDMFPAYPIQGISVGTGDGTKTVFNNPLCYFKAGTDKVYKNGVQLTRGVDYSINNKGNSKCLPELAEMPAKVYTDFTSSITSAISPIFIPSSVIIDNASPYARTFKASSPLYIEYENAITLNCLKSSKKLVYYSTDGSSNSPLTSGTLYVDASDDGTTYYQVASVTLSSDAPVVDFADTTAKYWRIRVDTTRTNEIGLGASAGNTILLNRKDPYIVFAEAPADGDVITMDVDMDLIMKNSNFVVDVSCQVNFAT